MTNELHERAKAATDAAGRVRAEARRIRQEGDELRSTLVLNTIKLASVRVEARAGREDRNSS